jgi:hypothetical protein
VITWPGNSPDLNPIENVWALASGDINKKQIKSFAHFKEELDKIWQTIDMGSIRNIIGSMDKRLQAVIDSQGLPIKY